jgi:cellulose synthase/poly-beta-1,6-N-acetylglucosamine synthase-like glycosyltransferase
MTLVFFACTALIVLYFLGYGVVNSLRRGNYRGVAISLLALLVALGTCYSQSLTVGLYYLLNVVQALVAAYIGGYWLISLGQFGKQRARQLAQAAPALLPTVTVIIAVKNEVDVIGQTIEQLLQLEYDPARLTILIIDDHSTDGTAERVRSFLHYPQVALVTRHNPVVKGKPAAVNEAMPTITSELICVFDADSLPAPSFLRQTVKHFHRPEVALVQGRNIQYNEASTLISRMVSFDIDVTHLSMYFPKALMGVPFFEGRGAVFRRSAFLEIGGFDTELPTEDWDLGFRLQIAGYQLVYDLAALNYEQATETVAEYNKQRYRWLSTGLLTFAKNAGPVLSSPRFTPLRKADFLYLPLYNLWALVFNPLGFLCLISQLNGYGLATNWFIFIFGSMVLTYTSTAIINQCKWRYLAYLPLMFLYYWYFTIMITWIFVDHYVVRLKPVYQKATHYQNPLQHYTQVAGGA